MSPTKAKIVSVPDEKILELRALFQQKYEREGAGVAGMKKMHLIMKSMHFEIE